jgi:hypothetical protein
MTTEYLDEDDDYEEGVCQPYLYPHPIPNPPLTLVKTAPTLTIMLTLTLTPAPELQTPINLHSLSS